MTIPYFQARGNENLVEIDAINEVKFTKVENL